MAGITKIGKRYRALVLRGGATRGMIFETKQMAQNWAATIEGEIEQLKASGFLKPTGLSVGDPIDRCIGGLYPLKRRSASKTRDLRVFRRKLGADRVSPLECRDIEIERERPGPLSQVTEKPRTGRL